MGHKVSTVSVKRHEELDMLYILYVKRTFMLTVINKSVHLRYLRQEYRLDFFLNIIFFSSDYTIHVEGLLPAKL